MTDISRLTRAAGIELERTATNVFGAAVENFARGILNPPLGPNFGGEPGVVVNRTEEWSSTDYASSVANSSFRPKLKFLFKVEFLFHPEVLAKFEAEAASWKRNFIFNIKTVDRPKVDFEYEDINQYNFRTKVLKQIKHRELTMTFADDVGNSVHEFFRFMMMVHSPITRRSASDSFDIAQVHAEQTGNGMLFDDSPVSMNDMAHRGVVETPIGNVIKAIKILQFFVDPTESLDYAPKEVAFFFINPRVVSFDLDDVSHESSDPNSFTMSFDYDSMVMTRARTMTPESDDSKQMAPVGDAPGDAMPTGRVTASSMRTGGGNPQGENNPYASLLAGANGRSGAQLSNETFGRSVQQTAGGGLGGLISSLQRGVVVDLGSSINQSFARPSRDVVVDGSTAGRDASFYTSSIGGSGFDQPGIEEFF